MEHRFLVHRRGDHVGVAVVDIEPGTPAVGVFMDDDSTIEIDISDPVPLGHKVAIADVGADELVLEYGTPIGRAPAGFRAGSHVHTHNLRSARW
jgi:(2R)-sulfolactate sulfo-lyase subunit alpha